MLTQITLATVLAFSTGYCQAGTNISSNTHPTNSEWNSTWGFAWKSTEAKAQKGNEAGALADCRDWLMNKDSLFAEAGQYKVVVSDPMRHWEIFIDSKGNGKGAAGCAVAP
jgi:hypothetical protein